MKQRNRYHATEINKANEELAAANLALSNQVARLEERIRTLESACEAAVEAFRKANSGVDIFALAPELKGVVEQLEGAIRYG